MRHRVRERGLEHAIEVASAGTSAWHIGNPPDERATAEADTRGVVMQGQAYQFTAADFERFDLVIAMDRQNADDLRAIAPPPAAASRVHLLREFDPTAEGDLAVPDPYFGGLDGFSEVFDMVDAACRGLIDHLEARLPAPG